MLNRSNPSPDAARSNSFGRANCRQVGPLSFAGRLSKPSWSLPRSAKCRSTMVQAAKALAKSISETALAAGEFGAVHLALELSADLTLMDERKAREFATDFGLASLGKMFLPHQLHAPVPPDLPPRVGAGTSGQNPARTGGVIKLIHRLTRVLPNPPPSFPPSAPATRNCTLNRPHRRTTLPQRPQTLVALAHWLRA